MTCFVLNIWRAASSPGARRHALATIPAWPLLPPRRRRLAMACLLFPLVPLGVAGGPVPPAAAAGVGVGSAAVASPELTAPAPISTPGPAWVATPPRWRWPLPGRPEVVRRFDPPDLPYGAGHRGVDLAADPGAPVLAAGPGVVGYAGIIAGRGVVTILHSHGLRTTYEPVMAALPVGRRVDAGTAIGRLVAGHLGCPRAACLHWGLLRGDAYLNPLSLLGSGPIRLLPLAGMPSAPGRRIGSATGEPPATTSTAAHPASPARPTATLAAAALAVGAGALLLTRRRPP
jgi:murein DD-endopeptidase MepM/ murein hydrolase activator NlpD